MIKNDASNYFISFILHLVLKYGILRSIITYYDEIYSADKEAFEY